MIDMNEIKESFDAQFPCHSQAELAIFKAGFEAGYALKNESTENEYKIKHKKLVKHFAELINQGRILP